MILALDQGTTSSRAILFDLDGSVVSVGQKEFKQYYPQPGWVEHDANEIWESQLEVARKALQESGRDLSEVKAMGITNQRETTLLWDRATGEPLAPAIVWQDRRTAAFCKGLYDQGKADRITELTGLVPDAYFSATKLKWLLDSIEGARGRAGRGELAFGTVDTWLAYKLSGGTRHLTDVNNASRTMLLNLKTLEWDPELLEMFDIPVEVLPEVRPTSEVYFETDPALLGASLPLGSMVGDQQAALFGQLCVRNGLSKNTYGTGCFMLSNTGDEVPVSKNRLLATVAWQRNGTTEYALEGSVFVAGAAVGWLRDGLGLIQDSSEVEALARQVEDSGGVMVVPAFTGLGTPYWDPNARGCILGLTRGCNASHLARATLEGIAFQVVDLVRSMNADTGESLAELRVDGGASANDLLMQMQADLAQLPVVRRKNLESTALGAAFLAGLAGGIFSDTAELESRLEVDRTFQPGITAEEAEERYQVWLRAVERSRDWASS